MIWLLKCEILLAIKNVSVFVFLL